MYLLFHVRSNTNKEAISNFFNFSEKKTKSMQITTINILVLK